MALVQKGEFEKFATAVAQGVAAEHVGDPLGELVVWLQMALRRESTVAAVYDVSSLEARLGGFHAPRGHLDLVRRTIANVWAQERSHAAYLEAMLTGVVRKDSLWGRLASRVDALLGTLEGQAISAATSTRLTQRLKSAVMLKAGGFVQDVPPFVGSLGTLSFRDFCQLNAELETTAIHGYQRMLALLAQLDGHAFVAETTFAYDLERFLRDEQFHHQVFLAMDGWFVEVKNGRAEAHDGALQPRLSVEECRAEVHAIHEAVYRGDRPAGTKRAPARKPKLVASARLARGVGEDPSTPTPGAKKVR